MLFANNVYFCKKSNLMSLVFGRESGYVFKIFSNEEERMHIHVLGDGHEAKFWLEPKIELAKYSGFSKHELNDIQKIVEKNAERFKEQYKQHISKRIDD